MCALTNYILFFFAKRTKIPSISKYVYLFKGIIVNIDKNCPISEPHWPRVQFRFSLSGQLV